MAYSTIENLKDLLPENDLIMLANDSGGSTLEYKTFLATDHGVAYVELGTASWADDKWADGTLYKIDVNPVVSYPVLSSTDVRINVAGSVDPGAGRFQVNDVAADNLQKAIADADGTIDYYIRKRYATPLEQVPRTITTISGELAIWHLYSRRNMDSEIWGKRRDQAMRMLEQLASGRFPLFDDEDHVDDRKPRSVKYVGPYQRFGFDKLKF